MSDRVVPAMTSAKEEETIGMVYGLKRVLRYGRPYWKIILFTILCMAV